MPSDLRRKRRHPHPAYIYGGYAWAVSYELEMLLSYLWRFGWPWTEYLAQLNAGIVYPSATDKAFLSYDGMVAFYRDIAHQIAELRPDLHRFGMTVAQRHGIDVIPWGMGYLFENAPPGSFNAPLLRLHTPGMPSTASEIPHLDARKLSGPTSAAADALLLYLHLAGLLRDGRATSIVNPLLRLDVGNPERHIMRVKVALGARRPPGRPAGRSRYGREENYMLLRSFMANYSG